jgi:hypothetical protein
LTGAFLRLATKSGSMEKIWGSIERIRPYPSISARIADTRIRASGMFWAIS